MSDLQTFGPIVVPTQIGDSLTLTLQKWLPDYLNWIGRQIGEPAGWLPLPNSYVVTDDADHWPEDEPPAIVVVVPGTDGQPKQNGDRIYRAEWVVSVMTYVTAGDRAATERLGKYYAAAIRACLVQQGELGGLAVGTQWRGEKYDVKVNDRAQRTLGCSEVRICVDVQETVRARGPATPSVNPTVPPTDFPLAINFPLTYQRVGAGESLSTVTPSASASPPSIPNLQLWLDATQLSLADGSAVADWPDLSPNAAHLTQVTPGRQPILRAAGLNGKPCVEFTYIAPAKALVNATPPDTLRPTSGQFSLFVVLQNSDPAAYLAGRAPNWNQPTALDCSNSAGDSTGWGLSSSGPNTQSMTVGRSGWNSSQDGSDVAIQFNQDVPNLIECVYDGQVVSGFRDGGLIGVDAGGALSLPTGNQLWIGDGRSDGGVYGGAFLGQVGEVIFYDRALTAEERRSVEQYLLVKWGISKLA